jgi:pyrroline-5-carboxylate reductase
MNRKKEISGATGVLFSEEVRAGDTILSVHLISGTTPNVTVEISNDNTNWVAVSGVGPGYGGTSIAALTVANTMAIYMVQSQYYRVSNSAGTAVVVVTAGDGWVK